MRRVAVVVLAGAAFATTFALGRSGGEEPARATAAPVEIDPPPAAPAPTLAAGPRLPSLTVRAVRRKPKRPRREPVAAPAPAPAAPPATTPAPAPAPAPAPVPAPAPAPAPAPEPAPAPPPPTPFYDEG
jgi:hypothetical protein